MPARLLRLIPVLAVLAGEFWFVLHVYHLDDAPDRQAVAWARLDGALSAGPQGRGATPSAAAVRGAVADLRATHAPGAAALARDADRWLAGPDDRSRADLARAVDTVGSRIRADQAAADRHAVLLVAALFLAVCVGWFSWFRRLARRHRAVQRALTEREVLDAEQQRLTALVKNSSDVVMTVDGDSTVTFVSPSVATVLGRPAEELTGCRVVNLVHAEDRDLLVRALTDTTGAEHEIAFRMRRGDGRDIEVEGTLNDLHADPVVHSWILTVRDVTERRQLERSLTHQAFHDSLTGLANRQLFANRLAHALDRPDNAAGTSVLFLDLDDFKVINDHLGHGVGDEALVVVAGRLSGLLRDHDTVARLGGDEFAVLLEETPAETAEAVARDLLGAVVEPIVLADAPHLLSASIGVAWTATGALSSADLLRRADVAMYAAKETGKSAVAVYDAARHDQSLQRLAARIELREAVAEDQLVLHFQPTVDLVSQRVRGFEALVRWQHPTRGLLSPDEFIPVAEQSGLIGLVGAWVLRRACLAAARLHALDPTLEMAVNVAPQQLADPDFPDLVLECAREYDVPPSSLTLEITETAIHRDIDACAAALARLRAHGVSIAIDDFGTGYSSLSVLSDLPVDALKIDKSFIDRIGSLPTGDPLVETILSMSSALSLRTVAEGVESAGQAAWLRTRGEILGQGFLWSRPVPLEAAVAMLADGPAYAVGAGQTSEPSSSSASASSSSSASSYCR